jgi:peptidyl-prolyl cis-trans isomerase C
MLFVCPAVVVLAQTPPPKPPPAPPQVTMNGVPVPAAAPAPTPAPDKVILTVGETKVTFGQFDEIINSIPENYRAVARGAGRKQFAENLVRILVLAQEGQKRHLDQTTAYKTATQFQNANILAGLTMEQINKDLKVSDADLSKYYDEHRTEFDQVRARHILIRFQGSPLPLKLGQKELSEAEALAKVQELRKKIVAGADFAEVATRESDDTGSGNNGGDLGTFTRGRMVPEFEQAAFSLKTGELSEPVKTQFGYHLIKVESHDTKALADAKPEIEAKLKPQQQQRALDGLKNGANVVFDPEYFTEK